MDGELPHQGMLDTSAPITEAPPVLRHFTAKFEEI